MNDISLYTRVTDVLFPFGGLGKVDPNILKKAAERGTLVHRYCAEIINGTVSWSDEEPIKGYCKSFDSWFLELEKHSYAIPKRLFCDTLMLTGECDFIYTKDAITTLVDFKTPLNEGKTWRLQGSAYSYLLKKSGLDVQRIEFVKLDKLGKKPTVYTYEEDFPMFLKCLDVYREFFQKKNDGDDEILDF